MAFKKQAKKAQAAIEFLMTYGWMLLVVLIVGALIFSFVDFGNLLPSSVEFSSSAIRGDSQASAAYNADYGGTFNNTVEIAFTYTGTNRGVINASSNYLSLTDSISGTSCALRGIYNDETGAGNSTATPGVPFLNGQRGTATFDCSSSLGGTDLIEGDAFEGDILIGYEDSQRQGRIIPNKGSARLPVQ